MTGKSLIVRWRADERRFDGVCATALAGDTTYNFQALYAFEARLQPH